MKVAVQVVAGIASGNIPVAVTPNFQHVTLGFNTTDVHDVRKYCSSLIRDL